MMISTKKWIHIGLAGVAGLFSQVAYAQNTFPMVSDAAPGDARPFLWGISDPNLVHGPGQNCSNANPCYYLPADIQKAYATAAIPNGNGGAGRTIAIVDAFHDPQVANNLAIFNTQWGLPACTVANGCLTIVNQTGGVPNAGFNAGWAQETNLDVQWVHVMAPNAKILLVEGDNNSFANLGTAVLYARIHSDVVTNSYGANEGAGETALDIYYSGSPVPILFSSGDTAAAGHSYPCASSFVVCVGGTRLQETVTGFRASETGWANGGGGCSTQVGMPAFQAGFTPCGAFRGMPDIAALADPASGAVVFLAANSGPGGAGFYVFGGTSLSSPMMAGVVAQIQNARITAGKARFNNNLGASIYTVAAGALYHYRFYDVLSGNNGFDAVANWDLVTGFGVPLSPALTAGLIALP